MSTQGSSNPRTAPPFKLVGNDAWSVVAGSHTGIFTTLRRDGYPISLPVWFLAHDGAIWVRSPRAGKKIARVRNDSRAGFLVESGEHWQDLRAVHLTGTATLVDDDEQAAKVTTLLDAKYAAFEPARHRLPEAMQAHYAEADRVIVKFTPDPRVLGWDNSRIPLSD